MRKIISTMSAIILIVCFVTFLTAGMLTTILSEKAKFSYYENRELAKFPKYSEKALIDGTYTSEIENWLKDFAAWREPLLHIHTIADMNFLKRPVVNDIVISKDVLLPWKDFEDIDEQSINLLAEMMGDRLRSHTEVTANNGGKFYYVAIPCQYICFADEYPSYMNNRSKYTDLSKTAFFKKLDEKNVNYIDILQHYETCGGAENFSSKVDNHFNIQGAYITYLAIMQEVKKYYPDIDILEEGDYETEELPNPYIGSRGRALFGLADSKEKMSIIKPLKEIPFERINNGFEGSPIVYQMPETKTENILYSLYMSGDFGQTQIDTNRRELPSILVYGDSFTNGVESLIWYSFDKMESLDFRHYNKMSLEEYIKEMKPEIVVCIRDYEAMLLPEFNGQ